MMNFTIRALDSERCCIEKVSDCDVDVIIPPYLEGYRVTGISFNAFAGEENLFSVELPNTLTDIFASAFANCTHLTHIKFPDSLLHISMHSFENCVSLQEIELPVNVNAIGVYAFGGCLGLKKFSVHKDNRTFFAKDGLLYYKSHPEWLLFCPEYKITGGTYQLPDNVRKVCVGAFTGSQVWLLDLARCEEIAPCAFLNCNKLMQVQSTSDRLKRIKRFAFRSCESLSEVYLRDGVDIFSEAFRDCPKLNHITLRDEDAQLHFYMPY